MNTPTRTPRITDDVLYVAQVIRAAGGAQPIDRPAKVIEVNGDGTLTLFVMDGTTAGNHWSVRYDAGGSPGSWHWPPKRLP